MNPINQPQAQHPQTEVSNAVGITIILFAFLIVIYSIMNSIIQGIGRFLSDVATMESGIVTIDSIVSNLQSKYPARMQEVYQYIEIYDTDSVNSSVHVDAMAPNTGALTAEQIEHLRRMIGDICARKNIRSMFAFESRIGLDQYMNRWMN